MNKGNFNFNWSLLKPVQAQFSIIHKELLFLKISLSDKSWKVGDKVL